MIRRVRLSGLVRVDLPDRTALMTDGGMVPWGGDIYRQRDPFFGVIEQLESLNEGVGREAPAAVLSFLPPADVLAVDLLSVMDGRIRVWIAEVDDNTGLPIGTPTQMADWIVDFPRLLINKGRRALEVGAVGSGERLFELDRGNSLSPQFHRGVHPGEAGLDNASGVATAVPWGAPSAPRGFASVGGGFGAGRNDRPNVRLV